MTNIPNQNIKDTYKERKALVGTNFLTIYVENTLPIFITKDSVITDTNTMIRKTSGAACNTDIESYDTTETNRFIKIATVQSPLTYNKVNLYYDTKWKDIILTPNLEFYSLVKNGNYDVRAYRLGNRNVLTSKMISLLGIEEASRVQLPEAKANTGMTTYLTSIPGFHSESFIDTSRFEESVGTFNLLHSDRSLMTILNLGTGSSLFTGNTLLPVYLLHQMSFRDYGFESVGLQDVSSTNLYVAFRF